MRLRVKKQFCKWGHDTFIVGRDSTGWCLECKKQYMLEYWQKYYNKNKNEILSKNKEYEDTHIEEILAYRAQYRQDHREENKEWQVNNYINKKEQIKLRHQEYRNEHKEEILQKAKEYYDANRANIQKYYEEHREEILTKKRQYRADNPGVHSLINLRNQTNRSLRIVSWGQENIKEIYIHCPKEKVVDHVIPLQGSKVSGLHVSWNLQYLTPLENSKKKNKIDLLKISELYGKLLEIEGLK